jgi:hypothetical protein
VTLAPAIIAAAVALVVSVVTAVLTPAVTSLRARREAISAKFDAALEALIHVQASRHIPKYSAPSYYPGTKEEYRDCTVKMAETSISHFIEQTVQAQATLASISRYVPEVRDWITSGWELAEEREPGQRQLIEERRLKAVRTERLFRASKPLSQETKNTQ